MNVHNEPPSRFFSWPAAFSYPGRVALISSGVYFLLSSTWVLVLHARFLPSPITVETNATWHLVQEEAMVAGSTIAVYLLVWLIAKSQLRDLLTYRETISSLTDGVMITDPNRPDNPITSVNSASLEITGYDPEEVIGQNGRFLQGEGTREETRRRIREALQQRQPLTVDVLNYRKDGTPFWNELTINPIVNSSGELVRHVGVQRDVTEARASSQELQETSRRFEDIGRVIDEVICLMDDTFSEILYINETSLEKVYGRSREEISSDPKQSLRQLVHPEDRGEAIEWTEDFLEDPDRVDTETSFRIIDREGGVRWVNQKYFKIPGSGDSPDRIVAIVEDVTEEKELERKLDAQQQRFRTMAETIDQAFFMLTPEYDWIYINSAFEEIYGVTARELDREPMAWQKHIPDEDLNRLRPDLRAQRNRTMQNTQEQELRIDPPDGPTRWVRVLIYPIREDGHLTRLVGTTTDITEKKRYRRDLQESERRFHEIAGAVNEVFWLGEPGGGTLHYVSPGVKEVWGLSAEQLYDRPRSWMDRVVRRDRDRVERAMETLDEKPIELEFQINRPDGTRRWIRTEMFPVRDETGIIYRYAGLSEDFTDRKELEENLKESLRQKTVLLQEVHHRVKNNLQVVSSLLGLQAPRFEDDENRELMENAQQRIRSMALVHQILYESEDLSGIDFGNYLRELVEEILRSYGAENRSVIVKYDIDPGVHLDLDSAIPCGLIVNELVSNALHHGINEDKPNGNQITVRFREIAGEGYEMVVSDRGPGLPEDLDPRNTDSLGLKLVSTLAEDQLNGEYTIELDPGTTVRISFAPRGSTTPLDEPT